jgi:hypothetical protein
LHLFAIAADIPNLSSGRIAKALDAIGAEFGLDRASAWEASTSGGAIAAAGLHHGHRSSPRRYVFRDERTLTAFDGLPVHPSPARAAYDAGQLASGWESWVSELEGQFCALRVEIERERVQLRLDTMGLVPVFLARHDGGVFASNSVAAIRSLLRLSEPDALGVSAMVGLGWAAGRHTLLDGVEALAGGAVHTIENGRLTSRVHFGPARLDRATGASTSTKQLAGYMEALTDAAARGPAPIRCAITAGRDSRLALGLVRARGIDARYYTIGSQSSADVIWARALADRFGLEHDVLIPQRDVEQDGQALAARLIFQADGLSDLRQLMDGVHPDGGSHLGVRISGIGGEIGRNGPIENVVAVANAPLLGRLAPLQRRVLRMKADAFRSLMTDSAQRALDRYTDEFFDQRLAEGWRSNEVADLFFAFERVGCHAMTAPRRASFADDLFTPFCTRRYVEYCLAMSPSQRFVEFPYVQLLRAVSPELAAFPFKDPLKPARPALAGARALRRLSQLGSEKAGLRRRSHKPATGEESFLLAWLESEHELLGDIFAHDTSPLWELISRDRVRTLMAGTPQLRAANLVGLLRVATVFWYFHGPLPAQDPARASSRLA